MAVLDILKAIIPTLVWLGVDCCDECDQDIPSRHRPPIPTVRFRFRGPLPRCSPGEYIDERTVRCSPCRLGTFVTSEMTIQFNNLQCLDCLRPKPSEYIKVPCTRYRDTELACAAGFGKTKESDCPCTAKCQPLNHPAPYRTDTEYWEHHTQHPDVEAETSPVKNMADKQGIFAHRILKAYMFLFFLLKCAFYL